MTIPDDILDILDPDIHYLGGLFDSIEASQQSLYVNVEEMNNLISKHRNYLSFLNYNIRSFNANSDSFFSMFSNQNNIPNILCLTETWFKTDFTQEIEGYSSNHVIRTSSRSGGVSLYVRNEINFQSISNFCRADNNIEINCIELSLQNRKICILGLYRPHSGNISQFCEELCEILEDRFFNNKICILLGDFNINLLSDDNDVSSFMNNMQSLHFLPLITKPTRFGTSNEQASLLDHVWFNSIAFEYKCTIIMNDLTDHCPVLFQLNFKYQDTNSYDKIKIKFRLNNDETRRKFKTDLANFNWDSIKSNDLNTYFDNYYKTLNDLYCKCFPIKIKYISKKQYLKPWITPSIHHLISLKSKYFHLLKLGLVTASENNRFKNRIKSVMQKAKKDYFNNYFYRNRTNLKKTWDMLKNLTFNNKNRNSIKNIIKDGILLSTNLDIAEEFNEYFTNIASNLENSLPVSSVDPLDYFSLNIPPTITQFNPVSPLEISNICKTLKNSKQNFDQISVPVFKNNLNLHVNTLCEIINLSFSSGLFPNNLKIARTIPIFKKGNREEISNYRPISILPFLSKIFEKCMHSQILNHFFFNNLISPHQFGFLKNRSTEDATLKLVETMYQNLNSKLISINIFVDFSKAFDTLNHVILIRKLYRYGIQGQALKLVENYLSNRKQYVNVNNILSSIKSISIGIPQGSVLGPLLFIIYVNDLLNLSNEYSTILFADDTVMSFKGDNISDLITVCNNEIDKFRIWTIANRLTVNKDKTVFNIISNINFDRDAVSIYFDNQMLACVSNLKYLGVIFDDSLKFEDHIGYISNKISKAVGILNKLKTHLPFSALKTLYYSLVHPYLNYCNLVWGGTYPTHLNHLLILQKRILRIIFQRPYLEHTNPLFLESKILKINDLYKYNLSKFMFLNRNNPLFQNISSYSTRNQNLLIPQFQRLTLTQHSINFQGPHFWNQLPLNIRNSNSLSIFQKNVKNLYLETYNNVD